MSIEKYCDEIIKECLPCYDMDITVQNAFKLIIKYLNDFPENLSVRSKKYSVDVSTKEGIAILGAKYFSSFYNRTAPKLPTTVPDEMVSFIMMKVFDYTEKEAQSIKISHLQSMAAEDAVGTFLERYLDSVLRPKGWAWCSGDFVKAIDFIKYENGTWFELQIKNRDNTENSSSSKIRENTNIQKWYRTKSKTGKTMWEEVPEQMKGLGLSEEGFKKFVESYLAENKRMNLN